MDITDFTFIRDVAARQPNFTIPPPYVLWLLLKIKGDICLVAEGPQKERLAYLLAVPVSDPAGALYVWQLATSVVSPEAIYLLLSALRATAVAQRFDSIYFSAMPNSASLRTIQKHIRMFSVEPVKTNIVPEFIAPGEVEFKVDLK